MKGLFKKIGVFMLMFLLPLTLVACGGSKEQLVWEDIVLKDLLPEIQSEDCDIITNDDESLYVSLNDKSESEGKAYKRECVEFGYTIDADEDSYGYEAYNKDGAHLSLSYISGLTIDLEAPLKMGNIKWPNSDIAKLIPQPESLYGKIEWEAEYGFVIYIGNTSLEQYSDYVDAVWNAGFTLDYSRGEDYFWADNADGYQVEVRYKGFNTMWIRMDEPDTEDDNGGSTENPPVSANKIELTKSSSDFDGKLYTEVTEDLQDMGFSNIEYEIIYDLTTGWLVSDGEIETVSINGDTDFDKGDEYDKDSKIIITYHTFKSNKPSDEPSDDPGDDPIDPPSIDLSQDNYDDSYTGTKYRVNIIVDFNPNIFLDIYDVNLRIDGRIFETLEHGVDGDYEYDLKPGKHIIAFTKIDDTTVYAYTELDVQSDMSVSYYIKGHEENIDLEETSKNLNAYYTVTLDPNGGEPMDDIKVKAGDKLTNPGRPDGMEEYQFKGWSQDGKTAISYPFYVNSNVSLKALWEEKPVLLFDECWERELSNYTIYILIDYYSDYVLYFYTEDTFVQKGRIISGDLYACEPATIEYSYGGDTWTETLKYSGTGLYNGTLIDGNGYEWSFTKAIDTEEAENYLKQIGYVYDSSCDYDDDVAKLNYSLDSSSNSYTITGLGTYSGSKIKIPTTYNGKPVTKIADRAFENNKTLTEVVISDSITSIGKYAFSQSNLKRIRISKSVAYLGEGAFYKCSKFENILFADGCKLATIEKNTFYDCSNIWNLTLPRYITRIEDYAFYNGCAQYGIRIPEKCEYIGNYAFSGVQADSITIESPVLKEIGDYAFANCLNLEQINFWCGSTEDWEAIKKGENWYSGSPLTEISCYKGSITIE